MDIIIQCIYAFVGTFAFAFVFRIHKNMYFALLGGLAGLLGWVVYLLSATIVNNIFIQSFIAMFCVSVYGEILARILKSPATVFIMVGCFPLVPGKGIYDTMISAINSEYGSFIQNGLKTFGIGLSLSLGIIFAACIFQIIKQSQLKKEAID